MPRLGDASVLSPSVPRVCESQVGVQALVVDGWSWGKRGGLEGRGRGQAWLDGVAVSRSVSEVSTSLVLFAVVSELGSRHDVVSHWHVDIVQRHCRLVPTIVPIVGEHLKSVNFLEP